MRTRLDFFFLFGLLPKAQTLWLSCCCCLCQFCQFWCCQPISVSATVTNPRHLDKKLRFELQAAASPRGVTNASFHFNAHVKGLWNGKIVQSRDILSCDANTSLAACETHSSSLCCHILLPPHLFFFKFYFALHTRAHAGTFRQRIFIFSLLLLLNLLWENTGWLKLKFTAKYSDSTNTITQ